MILLQLPTADILLLQRTNKTWHEVVESSVHLQRALYYKPDRTREPIFSPLLFDAARDEALERLGFNPLFAMQQSFWAHMGNTSWLVFDISAFSSLNEGASRPAVHLDFYTNKAYRNSQKQSVEQSGERARSGSWREMLLTQMPSAHIVIDVRKPPWDNPKSTSLPPGSTMGDVYDVLEAEYKPPSDSMEWDDEPWCRCGAVALAVRSSIT